jgi:stage II sporulation protein D
MKFYIACLLLCSMIFTVPSASAASDMIETALMFEEQGRPDEALKVLDEATLSHRSPQDQLFHMGRLYVLEGNARRGIEILSTLEPSMSGDKRLYWYMGQAWEDLGNEEQSGKCYAQALNVDNFFVPARIRRGELYLRNEMYRNAQRSFQSAIESDPSQSLTYKQISLAYLHLGEVEQAYTNISKYQHVQPADAAGTRLAEMIKQRLGAEYFRKKTEETRVQRQLMTAAVDRFAEGELPVLRVRIAEGVERFQIKGTGRFVLFSHGNEVFRGRPDTVYDAVVANGELIVKEKGKISVRAACPVEFHGVDRHVLLGVFGITHGKGDYWAGTLDTFYRGVIRVISEKKSFSLVNLVNVEEYVYGVLASEMFASWPADALRAQAVLARTVALKRKADAPAGDYELDSSTKDQVYLGVKRERPEVIDAVDVTRGVVMTYEGKLAQVFFSSNCGGHTRSNGYEVAYLKGVRDAGPLPAINFPLSRGALYEYVTAAPKSFCSVDGKNASTWRWQRIYTHSELVGLLNAAGFDCSRVNAIIPLERNLSGHVERLAVDTDVKRYVIEGELKIRNTFGKLRSSLFRIEVKKLNGMFEHVVFWGGGFGHAIGMCQYGAKGMAESGSSWTDILKHYFPELEIKKAYR